ncbi:ABC transporter substrate-binding protein [Chromobacterium alticapitis]|uniref:ABC transporter substrate-binding protein n=1 Tax=Chromobacterium alticapitis TaxID=2073169 RepID=A0A2S5DBS0_9NEIS|nr:ABC transporter substrate-binding protein [Chromobacterium alticapitis]POZ60535.1 ABC transporter substrate-binding protein [Chromobacterium alticapitis]
METAQAKQAHRLRAARRPSLATLFRRTLPRLLAQALLLLPLAARPAEPAANAVSPSAGPPAQPGHHVLLIAYDLRNGGISKTTRSFLSAAGFLRWQVKVADAHSDRAAVREQLLLHASAQDIAGVALVSTDSADFHLEMAMLKQMGKVTVGWHAGSAPGPNAELFANITTDPLAVARTAVDYAIGSSSGPLGAVIFTDSHFSIAMRKANAMKEALLHCKRCKVLRMEDVDLSKTVQIIPTLVPQLASKYGRDWTHTLAINDLYFDNINFPLHQADRPDIVNISAGDGSNSALNRIREGISQQKATVAEPCNQQGWQMADELNRGFVSQPILVTQARLLAHGRNGDIEDDDIYRKAYLAIWLPSRR